MTKDIPFITKELVITVRNKNNLPTIDYHKLTVLQGDLKTLSEENKTKLCNSILKYGFFVPAFIWRLRDEMYILDATQRYYALQELEKQGYTIPNIPYIEIEASDKKDAAEKLLQITSRYGEINQQTSFLSDFDLNIDELDIAIPELDIQLEDTNIDIEEDEVPEPPEEPLSKTGDLWLCGKHRVLCGDSTNEADVAKLMDGKKADMVFTDPPYGMGKEFENDKLEDQETFNELWLSQIKEIIHGAIIIWYKPAAIDQIIIPARKMKLKQIDYFHLYKPNDIAFPRNSWIRISESILVFTKGDKIKYNEVKPYAHGTYLWNHTTKDKSFYHPSVKPIEVVTDIISRIKADIIADFFLGSGTTLIAAEQTGRVCYGCEISEAYCDVILERYAKLTGTDPIREDGKKWSELKN